MRLATHKIHSTSGNEIEITIRTPAETVKGVIQINTGTCIPQRVYWKFAEYLTHHGYITLTYDYTDASNFSSEISHQLAERFRVSFRLCHFNFSGF